MRIKMRIKDFFYLILVAATLCCWTACSDSDDDEENVENDDRTAADYEMTAEKLADYATENFISHVCQTEVDTVTWRLKSWELNYGRVLYPATPYVRYTRAESQEAARQEFLSMICMEATIDSLSLTGEMTVNMGSHGSVKYIPGNRDGEWAHVDVNLKELPDLQEIVFSKPEAWPENASDCGVRLGTVFKKNQWGRDIYYICIDQCGNDGTGYLIGFDTWTNNGNGVNHYYKGRNCYHAYWDNLSGGVRLIEYLRGFLYYNDGRKKKEAEDIIRKICENQGGNPENNNKCGNYALYNFLYSEGELKNRTPFFKTGDDKAYMDTHSPIFVSGKWHWIRVPYTKMTPTKVEWTKIQFECDEIDPKENTHHAHDAWAKYGEWGKSWAIDQFGKEWIWKVGEWYSFQTPYIIVFHDTDAKDLKGFKQRYGLTQLNW